MRAARNVLVGTALGTVLAFLLGQLSADAPTAALGLALIPAFAALVIADAGLVVAATLPATYLTYRIGPAALDMSIADFTLVCGIVVAVAGATRYGRTLSGLLRVIAAYQVLMLVVVAAHPTTMAITEWVHRAGLMAGGMLVGAAIVRYQKVSLAVHLFVGTTVVFALDALRFSLMHGFAPAYPLGIHKNAAGSLLAMAIAFVVAAPAGVGVPVRFRRELYVLLGLGLLATRSRGAMVGLGAVLLIWVFTQRGTPRLRLVVMLTAVAGVAFVWTSVQEELRSDPHGTGAISIRQRQHNQAWEAYKTNTLRGAGIRYYDQNPALAEDGRPSSTVYEALAESGIVGAAGLALVIIGPIAVLRRGRSEWVIVAMAVYGVKSVHAIFDNFWVAGPFTLPWLIMGIAAALEVAHAEAPPEQAESEEREPALSAAT